MWEMRVLFILPLDLNSTSYELCTFFKGQCRPLFSIVGPDSFLLVPLSLFFWVEKIGVRKFIISNMVHLHISLDVGKHEGVEEGAEEGSSRFESDYCKKISEEQNMLSQHWRKWFFMLGNTKSYRLYHPRL